MELLLGCGNDRHKKISFKDLPAEWTQLVTLDMDEQIEADLHEDLNIVPYGWGDDNQFDEIHAYEVLEHTGAQGDWRFFFDQFYEFWRMLKPGGYFCGTVPMWDSKWAWGDPGHTRVINDGTLVFLDQKQYEKQVGQTAMSDYRGWWKGDFETLAINELEDTFGFVLQARK